MTVHMKRIVLLSAAIWLLSAFCNGQGKAVYAAAGVPENLSKGADAVVRDYSLEYTYFSLVSAAEKFRAVVTVYNEAGESDAMVSIYTNNFRSLKGFSGEIYDSAGNSIRKIKRSDLKFTDYFSGLASDSRTWYYESKAAVYPYTVAYEYEITHKDGILSLPTFAPVDSYGLGIQRAQYRLIVPSDTKLYFKNLNTDIEPVVSDVKGGKQYEWQLSAFEPVDGVPYRPDYRDLFPLVMVTAHDFTYNKKSGTMDSWDGYSRWQWSLLEGRDTLPESAKEKVRQLTAGVATDREKVAILYDYLKETRYVLVAIGISGFQPMSATEVYEKKFGDCKGLSNYMMAMLAECGIESYYTEIGSGSRKLRDDYVHPSMTDHAILYVPLEDGDLWLECTAPSLPMGYVHSDITDRKALVYRDKTAVLVDMPSYPDSAHVSALSANVVIGPAGNVLADVKTVNRMAEYENIMGFAKSTPMEQMRSISGTVRLPLAEISDIAYEEEKNAEPWGAISYKLDGKINLSESRGYIPANMFRNNPSPRLRRSRTMDIVIKYGYRNVDDITVEIPEGYSVEALPPVSMIENRFGRFCMLAVPVDGKIKIYRDMQLKKGTHSAEFYGEFRELMDAVSRGNGAQMVIVKK